jgi:hypothetical protein
LNNALESLPTKHDLNNALGLLGERLDRLALLVGVEAGAEVEIATKLRNAREVEEVCREALRAVHGAENALAGLGWEQGGEKDRNLASVAGPAAGSTSPPYNFLGQAALKSSSSAFTALNTFVSQLLSQMAQVQKQLEELTRILKHRI